jgi:hypothetical protein
LEFNQPANRSRARRHLIHQVSALRRAPAQALCGEPEITKPSHIFHRTTDLSIALETASRYLGCWTPSWITLARLASTSLKEGCEVLPFRLPPCRLDSLRLGARLSKNRQLGMICQVNGIVCTVSYVFPAELSKPDWRVHDKKVRAAPVNDLGAERDEPLHFFACSICLASGSVPWPGAFVAAVPLTFDKQVRLDAGHAYHR